MIKTIKIFAILAISAVVSTFDLKATDLGLEIAGNKNFNLNKNVGPIELKFTSSAPLEEIIGYAEDNQVKSYLNFDPANIEKASGKITFQVKSMETGIKTRDEHLYSETWLNAAKYPEISFELKELKNVKVKGIDKPAGRATMTANAVGVFSMHGKTKEISVPLTIIYIKESEGTKKRASGDFISIDGAFSIKLKDFDVAGKKGLVGTKVGETIDIALKLYFNSK